MVQRIRERLTLVLIALLPFHALLVTVGTKLIAGPGHAPLTVLALWKEALLVIILLMALMEGWRNLRGLDVMDFLILGLLLLSVFGLLLHPERSIASFVFGFKYDFVPLVTFLILRRVHWSDVFQARFVHVLLIDAVLVGLFAVISALAPQEFFTFLGYSDLHSLYLPGGPLAAFQQIEGVGLRRLQSTFSGPNQLGLWLLIPLGILWGRKPARPRAGSDGWEAGSCMRWILLCVLLLVLLLTFSRSAWIAAGVMSAVALWMRGRHRMVMGGAAAFCVLALLFGILFPTVIGRIASSRDHLLLPLAAIETMIVHPLGLGLGSAGPASNRFSDACVFLGAGSATSWAQDRSDLCVFVDSVQVQPSDRSCSCPLLTENWYLQIGVELGWIGVLLYLYLVGLVLVRLFRSQAPSPKSPSERLGRAGFVLLSFLGLSIAALFLHAFEDSAVAYTMWLLIALNITPRERNPLRGV